MSKSEKRLEKLKKQLYALRQKGMKDVVKDLSEEEAAYVRVELKYPITPCLYEIQTQRIDGASSSICQQVSRAHKRGESTIYKDLGRKDKTALEEAGVQFRPVKYRIILNAK